jgi:hypothetical protein
LPGVFRDREQDATGSSILTVQANPYKANNSVRTHSATVNCSSRKRLHLTLIHNILPETLRKVEPRDISCPASPENIGELTGGQTCFEEQGLVSTQKGLLRKIYILLLTWQCNPMDTCPTLPQHLPMKELVPTAGDPTPYSMSSLWGTFCTDRARPILSVAFEISANAVKKITSKTFFDINKIFCRMCRRW